MVLIHVEKITPRITYSFKHICTHILGFQIKFTSDIKEFISYEGPKFSYGKEQMGNEIFIQSVHLLCEQGVNDLEIKIHDWDGIPCFFSVSEVSSLPYDIFAASFYLLSRYEEYLPHVKDIEGRFPAMESIAYSGKFLEKPVVDIWALKFKDILTSKFPFLNLTKRSYNCYNLIAVSEVFKYKKKGIIRTIAGLAQNFVDLDFSKVKEASLILFNVKKDPYDIFEELINFHKENKIKFHFMFQLSDFSTFDKNINHNRKFYRILIKSVGDYGKIGLRMGFFAKDSLKILKKEKKRLESIINRPVPSAINTKYNLLLPDTYNNMIELEIKEDFSMGYPETIGFRAGTCSPFMFYDLNFEITTPLLIIPYIFNTRTPLVEDFPLFKEKLSQLVSEVKKVNGTFCGVFSNKNFSSEEKRAQMFSVLNMINGVSED